jgi:hypothetical protein
MLFTADGETLLAEISLDDVADIFPGLLVDQLGGGIGRESRGFGRRGVTRLVIVGGAKGSIDVTRRGPLGEGTSPTRSTTSPSFARCTSVGVADVDRISATGAFAAIAGSRSCGGEGWLDGGGERDPAQGVCESRVIHLENGPG